MRISVVVPAYNEQGMLVECLDSLARQVRPADEIIVVDNNSADNTAEVANSFGATVIREKQQGINPAVRTGYDAATGDIIARCDADSRLPADWLARIETAFANSPDLAAITGPGQFYGTNRLAAAFAQVWYMYAYFILVGTALAKWPLFGSNFAIRRSAWLAVQGTVHADRTDIHDDIDLTLHLPPTANVRLDRALQVSISARSLQYSGLRRRYLRGLASLTIHWPQHAPWKRWARKFKR